jgi:acetolactate synthase-1/2/3 large subunit
VEVVFGLPGTQTVELFELLRRSSIRVVLATNETAAAFMANGYGRMAGRPGVLLTIGGPGFTWALPGIAEARLDSVPLVHLVTAPATSPGSAFRLQAIDQEAIAAPLVKATFALGEGDDPARVLAEAFEVAGGGEPGPVMVHLARAVRGSVPAPADVRASGTSTEPMEPGPGPAEHPAAAEHPTAAEATAGAGATTDDPDELLDRFREARRPLLLLGQGSLEGAHAARELAERHGTPVLTTPSARGIVSEDHPACMPFDVLRGGVDAANELLEAADLVVGVGCKLGHNGSAGFQLRIPEARFVHVDRERTVLNANYPASLALVGDAVPTLRGLLRARRGAPPPEWEPEALAAWRTRLLTSPAKPPEPTIRGPTAMPPARFFEILRNALPDDGVLVTDTGLHQILTRRHFRVRAPRGLLMPSDFQSMGFGLPAALGAVTANTGRPVVALVGDGSFLMAGMELVTAVRDGLALPVIVFNDGRLNQIRLDQLGRFGRESAVELGRLDLAGFADAVGVEHVRFDQLAEGGLGPVLRRPEALIVEVGVGDSWSVRASATRARAKGMARAALGPRVLAWIKGRS